MNENADLGWLLDDLRGRVPEVTHAVAVSADGLRLARTSDLPVDRADHLAAIASGLTSLLSGASRALEGGGVVSNLTELGTGYMFLMALGDGTSLLVLAGRGCDVGTVSYEMGVLIDKVADVLTPAARGSGQ
jgi:predicted regulator of Ras-like GTPase activity (Roadblock/LC7/MglB family)